MAAVAAAGAGEPSAEALADARRTAAIRKCWESKRPCIILANNADGVCYAYTIGMPLLCKQPEFAVSGMTAMQAVSILNDVFDWILARQKALVADEEGKDAMTFAHDDVVDDKEICNVALKLRSVPKLESHLEHAVLSLPAATVLVSLPGFGRAFQLVWPDADGATRFPSRSHPAL